MARTIETHAGQHIRSAIEEAVELAAATNEPVSFDFNGTTHTVEPGEYYEQAKARIGTDLGFPILEAEEEAARARESLERMEREQKEAMASAGAASEAEMRDAEVPWIKTPEELSAYIAGLVDRPHDYGTCVYAMSMAAVAAFNYVSGRLGVSGFQASCADMDILRRTRRIENGFRIIPYDDLLYPQYWDAERAPIYEAVLADPESAARFAAKAQKLLDDGNAPYTVREHWQRIAALGTTGDT